MSTGHSSPNPAKARIANSMGKASILMEALPYIQRFRKHVVVVKYGGSTMEDPSLRTSFAGDITLLSTVGILPVIVHGGGPQITEALGREGVDSTWVDGLRVTDAASMRIVQRVLVGEVNADIVRLLAGHGAHAIGINGLDDNLLTATPRDPRLGFVGDIERVNADLVRRLLNDGLVPVIAPIARGEDGEIYNINADSAASAIATALGARKLVYLTDVEGVYERPDQPESLIQRLEATQLHSMLQTLSGGMLPKLHSVAEALDGGVTRAHILDGRVQHVLLLEMFTREGVGTMITQDGDTRP
jgi:acetylglutamate kinase